MGVKCSKEIAAATRRAHPGQASNLPVWRATGNKASKAPLAPLPWLCSLPGPPAQAAANGHSHLGNLPGHLPCPAQATVSSPLTPGRRLCSEFALLDPLEIPG